jgi:single-strand DNA-binding protein
MLDRRDDSNSPMQSQSQVQPAQNAQQAPSITPVAQDEFEDDIPF